MCMLFLTSVPISVKISQSISVFITEVFSGIGQSWPDNVTPNPVKQKNNLCYHSVVSSAT